MHKKNLFLNLGLTVIASTSVFGATSLASENHGHSHQTAKTRDTIIKYEPPDDRQVNRRTRGAGSRGCQNQINSEIIVLAPDNHIGTTIASHPTFFINLSETPNVPLRFSLVEIGVPAPLVRKTFNLKQSGTIGVTLPSDLPELKTGKEYRLTVGLICEFNEPNKDRLVQILFKRVEVTPSLKTQLSTTTSRQERAQILALNGVWYDAIAEAYQAQNESKQNSEIAASLLKQIGLKQQIHKNSDLSFLTWENSRTQKSEVPNS